MQRDFLLPSGFGEIEAGSLHAVQASVAPTKELLDKCRQANLAIFHTREGNKPDLSDCPSSKVLRQNGAPGNTEYSKAIGDMGEMGRLLIRGEHGHDIVDGLQPFPGEVVIDKPGKGAFWQTTLMDKLKAKAITHLIICGVTTECCFATTFREANDRGFECCKHEASIARLRSGVANATNRWYRRGNCGIQRRIQMFYFRYNTLERRAFWLRCLFATPIGHSSTVYKKARAH